MEVAMAFFDTSPTPARSLRGRLAAVLDTPFDRRQRRLAARIRTLRALPDAQLAARGLQREDILFHVFRDGRFACRKGMRSSMRNSGCPSRMARGMIT
jgi:hypothetical protein